MHTRQRMDIPSLLLTTLVLGLAAYLAPPLTLRLDPAPAPPPAPAVVRAVPVVLTHVRADGPGPPTVALTFDDGPDPTWTPQVLDVLRRHGAVATFCMVGSQMAKHPQLVAAVVAAGMRICSHSHSHDNGLAARSPAVIVSEILDVVDRAAGVPGADVRYFRAPGGNWSAEILGDAAAHDLQPLGWSVDPRDWKRPGTDAVVQAVQAHVGPGAVVLLHDGGGNRAQTVAALDRLLPWLAAQGYSFGFP